MSSSQPRDIGLAFMGGFIAALVVIAIVGITALRASDVYGLGHWKLNARMPLSSMWMNLGYWTNSKGEPITVFEEACAMLLRQVLDTAGLVKDGQDGNSVSSPSKSLAILDVGFGCGDQTWELVRLTRAASHWSRFRYVGLTMNQFQVGAAERRIYRETLSSLPRSSSSSSPRQQQHSPVPVPPADSFTLFCANAALPDAWKPNVKRAVQSMTETGDAGNDGSDGPAFSDRWFLALDCLYHFSPSRMPILRYAAKTLAANFMAFDLVLNDAASWKDVLKVRAIGVMMGCPFHTFLTEAQYTEQLIHCGYDKGSIIIRDISPQVFPGVVRFLEDQDRALSQYGISIGGFKLAGRLFDWFGRSKVVKASIVVARVAR